MAAKKQTEAIKARVLVECQHGSPDDVVELSAADLEQAQTMGQVDPDPAAVAYAESLAG